MIKLKAKNVSAIVLTVVAIGFAITYGVNWWAALTYPNAIEYEGPMLWAVNALTLGQNIYDPERLVHAPWAVITYPPLFLALGASLAKLFGLSFWCLRVITFASAIACVIYFYRALRLCGCSPLVAAIGPAYLVGYSPMFLWACVGRPDTLALAFCLAGLEQVVTATKLESESSRMSASVRAGLLLVLACFTKQTSLVCVVVTVLYLVWCRHYKSAAALSITAGVTGLAALAAIQNLTGGFLQNMQIFAKTPWDGLMLIRYLHFMSDDDVTRFELSFAVLLFCMLIRKQETTGPERLPYLLFGLSLAQMIYIMGLPGSNGNHAIFTLMSLSWWLALKCKTMSKRVGQIILLCSLIGAPGLITRVPHIISQLPPNQNALIKLDLNGKLVLSEDPSLNILSRSKPAMIDCAVFTSVWLAKPEKLDEISKLVASKQLAAIVLNCQDSRADGKYFWPSSILDTVRSHYLATGKVSGNGVCQTVWLPKSAP